MDQISKKQMQKIQFITKNIKNKNVQDQVHDIQPRMGDQGKTLVLKAQADTRYELLDQDTQRGVEKVRAKRVGRNLHIFLEDAQTADVIVEDYYDESIVQFPSDSLTGLSSKGDLGVYVIDEGSRPALKVLESDIKALVLLDKPIWWTPGWHWAPVLGLGLAPVLGGSSSSSPLTPEEELTLGGLLPSLPLPPTSLPVGDLTISGSVTAGPVRGGVTLYAYDSQGGLLGTASVAEDGTFSIEVPKRGDYRGTVLLKAMDSNESEVNYQ